MMYNACRNASDDDFAVFEIAADHLKLNASVSVDCAKLNALTAIVI